MLDMKTWANSRTLLKTYKLLEKYYWRFMKWAYMYEVSCFALVGPIFFHIFPIFPMFSKYFRKYFPENIFPEILKHYGSRTPMKSQTLMFNVTATVAISVLRPLASDCQAIRNVWVPQHDRAVQIPILRLVTACAPRAVSKSSLYVVLLCLQLRTHVMRFQLRKSKRSQFNWAEIVSETVI
jgi:hypothetical protein